MARDPHLDKLISDLKYKKFQDGQGQKLTDSFGENLKTQFGPAIKDAIKEGLSSITMPKMPDMPTMPEQQMPEIPAPVVNVPAPIVNVPAPIVNVPAPVIHIPETKFPEQLPFPTSFKLDGVDKMRPMPVMMVDDKGKPAQFNFGAGATGGKADFFTVQGIQNTVGIVTINPDGNATYTTSSGASGGSTQSIDSSGNPYSQANPLPVVFSSTGSTASALIDSSGIQYSGSNPLPVTITSGASATSASNIVDSTGVAYTGSNPVPVALISGVLTTTGAYLLNGDGTYRDTMPVSLAGPVAQGDAASALRVVVAGNSDASVVVNSGTLTAVTGITNSVQTVVLDRDGNPFQPFVYNEGDAATAQRVVLANNVAYSTVVNSGTLTAVTSITNSVASALVDSTGVAYSGSNPLPTTASISLPFGPGDAATATRFVQAGDSVSSVVVNSGTITAVTSITNSIASNMVDSSGVAYSGSNPVPVTGTLTAVTTVTSVTNSIQTVVLDRDGNPFQPFVYNEGDAATAQRVVLANNVAYSTVVNSGTLTAVTSITNSVAAANIDSSGVQYSGSNPFPFTLVTSATATLNTALTDSGGIQYSGSNPVPVTIVSGAGSSTVAVGDSAARAADNGGNPVKIGGIARTTNPTAYADGDRSNLATDKLGRLLTRPVQVRDLILTAYSSITTGTEATLLTAAAGTFADLIMITATNQSTVATQVDIRCTSAGNIVHTMFLPAQTGPIGWTPTVPWPQDATGNAWTVDLPDITGTTVNISALFSKEI